MWNLFVAEDDGRAEAFRTAESLERPVSSFPKRFSDPEHVADRNAGQSDDGCNIVQTASDEPTDMENLLQCGRRFHAI